MAFTRKPLLRENKVVFATSLGKRPRVFFLPFPRGDQRGVMKAGITSDYKIYIVLTLNFVTFKPSPNLSLEGRGIISLLLGKEGNNTLAYFGGILN